MDEPEDSVPVAAPPSRDLSALAMRAQVAAAMFGADAAPVMVGRYEILETLGVGGMGVVYAAWDESLGRRVALKLLPADEVGSDRERARLAREAQALAKLSHPNVVTVFEVGEHEQGVFVAMELVDGVSLHRWQQQQVRTRQALVDVYLQAGSGLAAAHRAGLVHRDFKPANVLVGNDGRVRVVDFGLAQGPGLAAPTTSGTGRQLSAPPASPVTRTGALVGTPAYMAPEQLAGGEADARADQFSFCVALYEALVGCRPYELAALRMAPERKVPPPATGARRLPLLLRRALRRGLQIEPPRRFADMDALLRAIEADATWRRRLWGMSGPLAIGLGAAWLAGRCEPRSTEPAPVERVCEAPAHGPAVAWSTRRDDIARAFAATRKQFMVDVWRLSLEPKLAAYAQRWSDAYVQVCREGDDSERALQITRCLERQAGRFDVVLQRLADVSARDVLDAGPVVDVLVPVEACLEPSAASAWSTSPAMPVERLRRFDDALVSEAFGQYELAERELAAVLAEVPAADPLRTEILLTQGEVQTRLGHHEAAADALAEAQVAAESDEREGRAVLAQIELFLALEQPAAVEAFSRLFQKLQLPRPSALHADYLDALGLAATDPAQAERLHRQALDERDELGRRSHDRDVIETRIRLANALADRGEGPKARAIYEATRATIVDALGAAHPEHAKVLFDLGLLAFEDGDFDTARPLFERAREIEQAAYGADSTQVARTEVTLAKTLVPLDEGERGLALAEHAWSVQRELPERHSDRIAALRALATIEFQLDHHARSLELHELLAEQAGTDDAPDVLHNIAWLQCQVGDCKASRRVVDQALTQIDARLLRAKDPFDEILRLYILHTSALVALAEGDAEKARVLLTEVLREAPKHPEHPGTPELIEEATKDLRRARRAR